MFFMFEDPCSFCLDGCNIHANADILDPVIVLIIKILQETQYPLEIMTENRICCISNQWQLMPISLLILIVNENQC